MLNLGICRKCSQCEVFHPAMLDEDGNKARKSHIECKIDGEQGVLGWDADIPEGCPYILEHRLSEEAVADLGCDDEDTDEEGEPQ